MASHHPPQPDSVTIKLKKLIKKCTNLRGRAKSTLMHPRSVFLLRRESCFLALHHDSSEVPTMSGQKWSPGHSQQRIAANRSVSECYVV